MWVRPLLSKLTSVSVCLVLVVITILVRPAQAHAEEQLPDLFALPPSDLFIEVTDDGHRLLRFTQKFANIGKGPLRIKGVRQSDELAEGYQEILDEEGNVVRTGRATSVIFHPQHKHWHANDVSNYEMRRGGPAGPIAAKNGKVSYCFVDDEPYAEYTGKRGSQKYLNCKTSNMGLSAGWVDLYKASLYDQWVNITDLSDGVYYLTVTGDPGGMYEELSRDNNTAWRKVEISKNGYKIRVMAQDEILLNLDSKRQDFPIRSRIVNGRALTSVRIAELLGASVEWNGAGVVITKFAKRLEITPDDNIALVNGQPVDMGAYALWDADRVLVPVRFLCGELGAGVTYDWLSSTIKVTSSGPTDDSPVKE